MKGIAKRVEMIALETYDRECDDLDEIVESEEAIIALGSLTRNKSDYVWWERIQKVHALLNKEKLPGKGRMRRSCGASANPSTRAS